MRIRQWLRRVCLGLFVAAIPVAAEADTTAHDFTFTAIEGGALPLRQFEGKAVMVVNTASFCGFTHQYEGLADLWARYRDRGLVIVGVPSNDFGAQEPGADHEIQEFCEVTYGIDFPMTSKVHVRGTAAHPFYQWAASELGRLAVPRWNFHKYLIAPDGQLVDWFSTVTPPTSKRVTRAIERVLPPEV